MNLYKYHSSPEVLIYGTKQHLAIPEAAYDMLMADDFSKATKNELEKCIVQHPPYAYYYAKDKLHSRWVEAEPYIMKDSRIAWLYAVELVKGRWVEAEPYIMKNAFTAFGYAKTVIEGRWPEAEPYIKQDPDRWQQYIHHFNMVGVS